MGIGTSFSCVTVDFITWAACHALGWATTVAGMVLYSRCSVTLGWNCLFPRVFMELQSVGEAQLMRNLYVVSKNQISCQGKQVIGKAQVQNAPWALIC
jgi:hypothetical protein